MGIVTSWFYRTYSTSGEVEFLSEELESLNIACEAVLFFAIGLGLEPALFFSHLPIDLYGLAWHHADLAGHRCLVFQGTFRDARGEAAVGNVESERSDFDGLDCDSTIAPGRYLWH